MEKLIGNLLYGQSGGPTSIINTSAYGIFIEAFKHKDVINSIYAMNYGIQGLLDDKLIKILDNDTLLKNLLNTPGSAFGSNRFKLKSFDEDPLTYKKILEIFKKYNIRYFFYNGGNDSMDTINKISTYLEKENYKCNCIGIIKTIDNDLPSTDFSLGYPSAAKFIINAALEIYLDDISYKEGRVNIIETMGRNAGWLAASAKLLEVRGVKADLIYVPEVPFDLNDFLNKVEEIYNKKKHALIIISEGLKNNEGSFIFETNSLLDSFGHNQLGGLSIKLANLITSKLGIKTRYYELSLLQRANSICNSKIEQKIAIRLSKFAVKSAINGVNKKIAVVNRISSNPFKYNFKLVDINDIANKERYLDDIYINKENNYINDNFIEYLLPLIDGEKGLLNIYKINK